MTKKRLNEPKLRWGQPRKDRKGVTGVMVYGDYGDFKVELIVAFQANTSVLIRVLIIEGDADLTVSILQDLKLGELRSRIAKSVRNNPKILDWELIGGSPTPEQVERAKRLASEVRTSAPAPNRGQGAKSPDFYRLVAEEYLTKLDTVGERGVVKAMAEERNANYNTVSGWVREARKQKWLGPAPSRNRAGGDPGQRLNEWKEEHE